MMCRTCSGSGNIMSRGLPLEWFGCPACDGSGARQQFGPCEIVIRPYKAKKSKN